MRLNPYEFSNVSDDAILHPQPARISGCVTPLLACGFICIALATGLMHFVMAGLLAIPVIVVAFGLVVVAGLLARGDGRTSWWLQLANFALFIVGVLSLIATSANATLIVYSYARADYGGKTLDAPVWRLMFQISISFMAATAIAVALRCRTRWSRLRCIGWGMAAFGVVPTAILIFYLLKFMGLPLTA